MNWFVKLFTAKPLSQSDHDFSDACKAFTFGKQIWTEAALAKGEGWQESKLSKIREALALFDEAIKKGLEGRDESESFSGFDESEVYSLRGSCLNDLGYYFDALADYDKAIAKSPRKGIASNYHMRALIKDSIFDFDGCLSDFKEAIRLSKLENADNAYWNDYAKSKGFSSATAFYEQMCPTDAEIAVKKRPPSDNFYAEKLKEIKRRELPVK